MDEPTDQAEICRMLVDHDRHLSLREIHPNCPYCEWLEKMGGHG